MRSREAMGQDYRLIRKALKRERTMRGKVLAEPKRSAGMTEMDNCLLALERLGLDVGAKLEEVVQMSMFENGGSSA